MDAGFVDDLVVISRPNLPVFPVFFPVIRKFEFGDWFESDCIIKLLDALVDAGAVTKNTAIDSTYVKAQRAAFGTKGGVRRKQSAVRAVGGPRRSMRSPTSSGAPMR
jgi:hypothetical protein